VRGGHVPPGIRMPLLPRYVSSSSYDIHASSSPYDMVMIDAHEAACDAAGSFNPEPTHNGAAVCLKCPKGAVAKKVRYYDASFGQVP